MNKESKRNWNTWAANWGTQPQHLTLMRRRTALFGLGLLGAGWLSRSLRVGEVRAATEVPRRVIFVSMGHGTLRPAWLPTGVGGATPTASAWNLGPLHQSLLPFREKLNLISGLSYKGHSKEFFDSIDGDGHDAGTAYALTNGRPVGSNASDRESVDNLIARTINAPTPVTIVPAAYIMIQGENANGSRFNVDSTFSYSGSNQRIPYDASSRRVFDSLFPYGQEDPTDLPTAGESQAQREARKRRSVLDFAAREYQTVAGRLSAIERQKLEQHADAIRDLEARIALSEDQGTVLDPNVCQLVDTSKLKVIGTSQSEGATTPESYLFESEIRMRLAVAALSCDTTRVVSLAIGNPPGVLFGFDQSKSISDRAGAENQHDLQHDWSDSTSGKGFEMLRREKIMQTEQIAQLLGLLDGVIESDGQTLLDHTAVVCVNQIANGNHDQRDHRWIVAGGLGGYLRTGQYHALENVSHADVLTTIANGMGVSVDKVGTPETCSGPFQALRT